MPTTIPTKCKFCEEVIPEGNNFCDAVCFELWYALVQAKLLNDVLEKILNESFEVVDANTRPS